MNKPNANNFAHPQDYVRAASDYDRWLDFCAGAIAGAATPTNAKAMFDVIPERAKQEVCRRVHALKGLECEGC